MRNKLLKTLFPLLLFQILTSIAWAGYSPIKGMIPKEYGHMPATDLVYKGKVLLPEEAHQLYLDSGKHFDLSLLNPIESSDIWQNSFPEKLDSQNDQLPINYMDSVEFVSTSMSRIGNFYFNVNQKNEWGVPETFTLAISKKIHNFLLRKALLRKIGYRIPPIKYLKKLKITFNDLDQKKTFLSALASKTFASADRWVVHNEENELFVIVQDLVAMESQDHMINLAKGFIGSEDIKGRRLLNSLLVPYNLVDVPESVNAFQWHVGRIVSNNVLLPYEYAEFFSTTYEDARWITRRIAKLTRQDWKQIVQASNTPSSVQALLLEKLLARRNNLCSLLDIDVIEFEINGSISNGEYLVDGKLTKEYWPGFGSRFAFGDPESPLSTTELTAYIKSRAFSWAVDAAVGAVNNMDFLATNIAKKNREAIDKMVAEGVIETLKNNSEGKLLPVASWSYPTARANLILSRNIIAGSYLGTDNLIQLVDTIGVNLGAGLYLGVAGLTAPVSASARVNANYARTYAHLKPITSVHKALKYPFKNMLVPVLKRKYGKYFNNLLEADLDTISQEEKNKLITEALDLFKENLQVGESLVITDSLNAGGQAQTSGSFYKIFSAQLGLGTNQVVLSRLHIYRKSENVIQIYKDFGNLTSAMVAIGLNAGIPVVKAQVKTSRGTAKTKLFNLNINPENPQVVDGIKALRSVLFTGSLEHLRSIEKPFVLKHKFKETEGKLGIFVLRMNKLKSSTHMELEAPQGQKIKMFRRYIGKSTGLDAQAYLNDLLGFFTNKLLKTQISLTGMGNGNPGFSFMGRAKNKLLTYEAIVDENNKMKKPFIRMTHLWNGWRIKKRGALKILKKIKNNYGFKFYPKTVLNDTKKLFLYNINVNLFFYKEALECMFNMTDHQIKSIFNYYSVNSSNFRRSAKNNNENEPWRSFLYQRNRYKKFLEKNKVEKYTKAALKAVEDAEQALTTEGLITLSCGPQNLYIVSSIDGFREGDEQGDKSAYGRYEINPNVSNSIGELGTNQLTGPLGFIRNKTEMTESEFFVNWIMGRVI